MFLKIENTKNSKKNMSLKVQKLLLSGMLIGCIPVLAGCEKKEDFVISDVENTNIQSQAGFIIEGQEIIPFVESEFEGIKAYYWDEEYIGYSETISLPKSSSKVKRKNSVDAIVNDSQNITYVDEQVVYFSDVYPNAHLEWETISDTVYEKYKEHYLKVNNFPKERINQYELEYFDTGKIIKLIGYQISDTQFFNYETFTIENYEGCYNVICITNGYDLEQDTYTYGEVLDIAEEKEITKALENNTGFIVDGEETIPFYILNDREQHIPNNYPLIGGKYPCYKEGEVYSETTGEYIGTIYRCDDVEFSSLKYISFITDKNLHILYWSDQIAYLNDFNIEEKKNSNYENLRNLFLESHLFEYSKLDKYIVENVQTGEQKIVLGYRVEENKIFNYETFKLENYSGYKINLAELIYQNESDLSVLEYSDILDIIELETESNEITK